MKYPTDQVRRVASVIATMRGHGESPSTGNVLDTVGPSLLRDLLADAEEVLKVIFEPAPADAASGQIRERTLEQMQAAGWEVATDAMLLRDARAQRFAILEPTGELTITDAAGRG